MNMCKQAVTIVTVAAGDKLSASALICVSLGLVLGIKISQNAATTLWDLASGAAFYLIPRTHLISLAISSSVSRLLLSMKISRSTMATRPTIDPSVAAAIMPALEAVEQITDQYVHLERYIYREKKECMTFISFSYKHKVLIR